MQEKFDAAEVFRPAGNAGGTASPTILGRLREPAVGQRISALPPVFNYLPIEPGSCEVLLHGSGLFGDHRSQRAEKAVRFVVGAGGKEQRCGWTRAAIVAEGERPKSING
jgi:hypothetical protein